MHVHSYQPYSIDTLIKEDIHLRLHLIKNYYYIKIEQQKQEHAIPDNIYYKVNNLLNAHNNCYVQMIYQNNLEVIGLY